MGGRKEERKEAWMMSRPLNHFFIQSNMQLPWLMLHISLTWLREAQMLVKQFFKVYLWGCLWEKLAFESWDWEYPHQYGQISTNLLKTWIEQKGRRRANVLFAGPEIPIFCPKTLVFLVLRLLDSDQDLHWIVSPASLVVQLAESKSWDFSVSISA